ncbi:MAG TPA: XdhC family protein [Mucilaginibacter sp.]|nr:XdhC family protein [Mucilaginibacter sp.]
MKEIKAIIKAYEDVAKAGVRSALATVVRVEGSSYRRTGARMLVMDNGLWVGGISGGCLEGDALKRARAAIQNLSPTIITYDTTDNDPYQIGVGLGCNGIIDVLFTPLDAEDKNNPVEVLKTCISAARRTHVLLTVTAVSGNWPEIRTGEVLKYEPGDSLYVFDGAAKAVSGAIKDQLAAGHSAPHHFSLSDERALDLFIEILPPAIHLILMGHQYDVYPLSRLAKEMDWELSIVANLHKLNTQIVALADRVLAPESFDQIRIDDHTAIVLMAHDYKTDKYNLMKALGTGARYIGMLGPRIRSERIWDELEREGCQLSGPDQERIYAPVGLDIGAITPEEIALSLMAEVKAVLSGREGAPLRYRPSTIHQRD